jgi:hypothetical protein
VYSRPVYWNALVASAEIMLLKEMPKFLPPPTKSNKKFKFFVKETEEYVGIFFF